MNRFSRLAARATLAAGCLLGPAALAADQPFALPPLPYASDALEPAIDRQTMEIHHGRHHRAYVDNLNGKVKDYPELAGMDIEAVMAEVSRFDAAVRNNGGGHYNHALFWRVMAPAGQGGQPSPALARRIEQDFGSQQAMIERFSASATQNFGSGWTWLVRKPDGALAIVNTPNQDNPLMDTAPERGTPLLGLDTWEHAYYLKYRNKRPEYIKAWWTVVNWNEVSRRYEAAQAS
ncbi:superoxide dismutase [Orrella sp. JC864]|uniref:superoxide dismutase n=1 Tax=Orrella sp. JC864 TaxID=3120298 RepID=UPI0012BD1E4E